jgi:hypothetical protein
MSIVFVVASFLRLQTKAAACVRSKRLAIGADDLDARGRSPCVSKDPAIVRRRSRGSLPRLHLSPLEIPKRRRGWPGRVRAEARHHGREALRAGRRRPGRQRSGHPTRSTRCVRPRRAPHRPVLAPSRQRLLYRERALKSYKDTARRAATVLHVNISLPRQRCWRATPSGEYGKAIALSMNCTEIRTIRVRCYRNCYRTG